MSIKDIRLAIIKLRDASPHSEAAQEAIRASLQLLKDAPQMGMTPREAIEAERQAAHDTIDEAPARAPWHREQEATYAAILDLFP